MEDFGSNQDPWDLEDAMREAYPFLLLILKSTEVGSIPRGGCNTPNSTPCYVITVMIYIEELKAKDPLVNAQDCGGKYLCYVLCSWSCAS